MTDEVLTRREIIRKRPGMYVGGTGPFGIQTLALEVIGNAVDLVLAGRADSIEVVVHGDGSIEVRDNGPGLDLDDDRVLGYFVSHHDEPTADGHTPHVHIGPFGSGLGLFIVTSLCERVTAESVHAGFKRLHQWADAGTTHRVVKPASVPDATPSFTSIRFWPDPAIFGSARLASDRLLGRLNELQLLIPNLRSLAFSHESPPEVDGLRALMVDRLRLFSETIWRSEAHLVDDNGAPIVVDLALALGHEKFEPHQRFPEQMLLYCNFHAVNEESGLHRAIRAALGTAEDEPLAGVAVACNLQMLAPTFSGPTKQRVDDPVAMAAVASATAALLDNHGDLRSAIAILLSGE